MVALSDGAQRVGARVEAPGKISHHWFERGGVIGGPVCLAEGTILPQLGFQKIEIDRLGDEADRVPFAGPTAALVIAVGRHHDDRQPGRLWELGYKAQIQIS